jgi:sensor c-di-GMP phosphodiesterase-like protein
VVESLNHERNKGVRIIAMDDLVMGYHPWEHSAATIDTLKIDRSFITGVELGKSNEKIARHSTGTIIS